MPKVAEQKDILRPHELCRLGERVTIFSSEKADDEYHWGRYKGKVKIVHVDNPTYVQFAVRDFLQTHLGQVYTGMNKENDWSRTFYWDKGWHIVNRSGDYAVVQTPECGVDCQCEDVVKGFGAARYIKSFDLTTGM